MRCPMSFEQRVAKTVTGVNGEAGGADELLGVTRGGNSGLFGVHGGWWMDTVCVGLASFRSD